METLEPPAVRWRAIAVWVLGQYWRVVATRHAFGLGLMYSQPQNIQLIIDSVSPHYFPIRNSLVGLTVRRQVQVEEEVG